MIANPEVCVVKWALPPWNPTERSKLRHHEVFNHVYIHAWSFLSPLVNTIMHCPRSHTCVDDQVWLKRFVGSTILLLFRRIFEKATSDKIIGLSPTCCQTHCADKQGNSTDDSNESASPMPYFMQTPCQIKRHQGSNAKFFPQTCRTNDEFVLRPCWRRPEETLTCGGRFVLHTNYEICCASGPDTPLFIRLENCEKQDAELHSTAKSVLNIGIHLRVCPLCVLGHLWSNAWSRESPKSLILVAPESTLISAATKCGLFTSIDDVAPSLPI